MTAHQLQDVTVVADAGMISDANKRAIEQAGLSFILGAKIGEVPYVVEKWRHDHPDEQIPDGHIFTQPWPAGPTDKRRDQTIFYQYRAERARRTLRGIDEQVANAEKAVAGKAPVKRNRFIHPHRPPLPHHPDPGRRTHPHRPRAATRRPPPSPRSHPQPRRKYALI